MHALPNVIGRQFRRVLPVRCILSSSPFMPEPRRSSLKCKAFSLQCQ